MEHGDRDTEHAVLEHHRARLRRFAEERRRLEIQERASRLIVEGLELELGEAPPADPQADVDNLPDEPVEGGQSTMALTHPPSNGAGLKLTAREAAKRIMGDAGGGWRSQALVQETVRRGWQIDAQRPVDAFRTALLRMEKDGEAVRVDRGVYALTGDAAAAPDSVMERGEDET